jgi:hypothetical protein
MHVQRRHYFKKYFKFLCLNFVFYSYLYNEKIEKENILRMVAHVVTENTISKIYITHHLISYRVQQPPNLIPDRVQLLNVSRDVIQ